MSEKEEEKEQKEKEKEKEDKYIKKPYCLLCAPFFNSLPSYSSSSMLPSSVPTSFLSLFLPSFIHSFTYSLSKTPHPPSSPSFIQPDCLCHVFVKLVITINKGGTAATVERPPPTHSFPPACCCLPACLPPSLAPSIHPSVSLFSLPPDNHECIGEQGSQTQM